MRDLGLTRDPSGLKRDPMSPIGLTRDQRALVSRDRWSHDSAGSLL